jgi:hypothetical protein
MARNCGLWVAWTMLKKMKKTIVIMSLQRDLLLLLWHNGELANSTIPFVAGDEGLTAAHVSGRVHRTSGAWFAWEKRPAR